MSETTPPLSELLRKLEADQRGYAAQIIDPKSARDRRLRDADILKRAADIAEIWDLITALRADEGHSVEIISDNADFNGLPNCCIFTEGDYTNWEPQDYRGETVLECLQKADAARRAYNDKAKP